MRDRHVIRVVRATAAPRHASGMIRRDPTDSYDSY
jgi:hypothetical protein